MFIIDITLKNTPLSLSVQRKTEEDAEAIYQKILEVLRSGSNELLELSCEKQPGKKIGIMGTEISAVQISDKAGTAAASGRPPGFLCLSRMNAAERFARDGDRAGSQPPLPVGQGEPVEALNTPAIQVQDLSFRWYKGEMVLESCSLAVPQGEFWMLLGTNGSGKSTLLKLLATLLPPQAGSIQISPHTGFVFQNPDHQLVMPTVGADVAFGLVAEKLTPAQVHRRVEEALDAVNLRSLIRRPIYALSGGQKQRVAIAGAIARHCEVLLLDEPTALLDPDSQLDLVVQVKQLVKSRGLTALWVTHRLDELDYCDGAFLLANGQVVDRGDPQRLKQRLMQIPV